MFVSGAFRSGTTLLEKALSNHPRIRVGSQPFPFLFFAGKQRFYESRGIERRYPLGHLFGESSFTNDEFIEFLRTYRFDGEEVAAIARAQRSYSGWWTPELVGALEGLAGGSFSDVFDGQNEALRTLFGVGPETVVGSKEILCEEYLPYLIRPGRLGVIVVRDPRDVLTSLNFGKAADYTGEVRPALFVIRVWRKSVAFLLKLQAAGSCLCVRYEDLVSSPLRCLNLVTEGLGLDAYPAQAFKEGVRDQFGRLWRGNSSFGAMGAFSPVSVGKHRSRLPAEARRYVEACCWPEMKALGYRLDEESVTRCEAIITSYREPFPIERSDFPSDYSFQARNVRREVRRLEMLRGAPVSRASLHEWFLFPEVFDRLRGER